MEINVQIQEQHNAKNEDGKHGLHNQTLLLQFNPDQFLNAYLYATIISYKLYEAL
jgi:hypothetical protein